MCEEQKHTKRVFKISADGSHTLYVPELNENYHSTHGAIRESMHVFIQHGLNYSAKKDLTILEVGFGTGLNAFLTSIESLKRNLHVYYMSVEKYPLERIEWETLNYPFIAADGKYRELFNALHESDWEKPVEIVQNFTLQKIKTDLKNYLPEHGLDLVYFDAFSPDVQPDLWSSGIFNRIYPAMNQGGILTTYSVKGIVKRRLSETGFHIEKLVGPPGKHHMLRAVK